MSITANIGDNTITVENKNHIKDWKIGDEIVLGANKLEGIGYEKLKI